MSPGPAFDSKQYDFFGSKNKEPPQLTLARSVLGVGREAGSIDIKKVYRQRALECHPDRNAGDADAGERFKLLSEAYRLLSDSEARDEAESEFHTALSRPFYIGERLFCLGSMYGVRVYLGDEDAVIDDPERLIGSTDLGGEEPAGSARSEPVIYGSRDSILESPWADMVETIYGGAYTSNKARKVFEDAFMNRGHGGLDDLAWIRESDIAAAHFMERKFALAVGIFAKIYELLHNIIFMYRYGICLEAMASEPGHRQEEPERWNGLMTRAIFLYEGALEFIARRDISWVRKGEFEVPTSGNVPASYLTVQMQLADAYELVGDYKKARNLWHEIREADPTSYEAQQRARKLSTGKARARELSHRIKGFLSPH